MRALLIDDDQGLADLLKRYMRDFLIEVVNETSPTKAIARISQETFDVVILDVMLPEMDGFEAFKQLRKVSALPVLMLTARGEVADRIVGLEMGVDDYLPKPFEPRELVARLKALVRRAQPVRSKSSKLQSKNVMMDLTARTATRDGEDMALSTYEFELLKIFMTHPQMTLSRDRLLDELRGAEWEAYNRSIDVAISRLRQKLKDSARSPQFLKTVWGDGYVFVAPVEEI